MVRRQQTLLDQREPFHCLIYCIRVIRVNVNGSGQGLLNFPYAIGHFPTVMNRRTSCNHSEQPVFRDGITCGVVAGKAEAHMGDVTPVYQRVVLHRVDDSAVQDVRICPGYPGNIFSSTEHV